MIDFLKYRAITTLFSVLILFGFIGTVAYRRITRGHVFSYSVDFTGGTQVLFKFSKSISDQDLRKILDKNGWTGAIMRDFGDNEKLVRLKEEVWKKGVAQNVEELEGQEDSLKDFSERMATALSEGLEDTTVTILSINNVSSGVGAVLQWKSMWSVLIALFLMLSYIWLRFWSVSYGFGAVISLAHDAIVILLIFLLLDKEISIELISAILMILGYSINDTIVIFTRIRQNLKTMKNIPLADVVNISINQTLRRTLLTSFATILVVLSLFFLGGEVLRDLSLALLVGMIFGTYSSIYIASPVMLLLNRK